MGLDEGADEVEVGLVGDGEQDDGAVAGDAVAPEGGLVAAVGGDDAGASAAVGAGVEEGAGEAGVVLDVGFADAELGEEDLAAGPGEGEDAFGHAGIVAAVDVGGDGVAVGGDAEEGVDADGFAGFDADAVADGGGGIEDESGAVGEGPGGVEGGGAAQGAPAADDGGAVGFEGGSAQDGAAGDEEGVEEPGVGFAGGAGAAGEDERGLVAGGEGLDEELVEGGVGGFAAAVEEDDFGVAGDFDGAGAAGEVGEGELAQFHVVFGADGDLEAVLELVDGGVEFGGALGEDGFVAVEVGGEGLAGGGPGAVGVHSRRKKKKPWASRAASSRQRVRSMSFHRE